VKQGTRSSSTKVTIASSLYEMHSLVAVVVASFVGFAVAQTIDPSTVPIAIRDQWCQAQITACPLICLQTPGNTASTEDNSCDPSTLDFSCVCSDGQSPNATEIMRALQRAPPDRMGRKMPALLLLTSARVTASGCW